MAVSHDSQNLAALLPTGHAFAISFAITTCSTERPSYLSPHHSHLLPHQILISGIPVLILKLIPLCLPTNLNKYMIFCRPSIRTLCYIAEQLQTLRLHISHSSSILQDKPGGHTCIEKRSSSADQAHPLVPNNRLRTTFPPICWCSQIQ